MTDPRELPEDLSFEDWMAYLFAHDDPGWHLAPDAPYWNDAQNPELALAHLSRLFSNPKVLLGRFTPDQIGSGLNFVINNSCSNYAFVFLDATLPIERRVACIRSIACLYTELFPEICIRAVQYDEGQSMADYLCFMFWDVFPMYARTKNPFSRGSLGVKDHLNMHLQIEAACLDAMEASLQSDHPACQKGALHGLGHWQVGYSDRVARVIDRYLAKPNIWPELLEYAEQARQGSVL